MLYRSGICGFALAAALTVTMGGAQGAGDAIYPNWKGQWQAINPSLADQIIKFDPTKRSGPWQQAPLTPEYQRALELDPQSSNAHHWYGLSLSFIGRHQEALVHLKRAVELDPPNLKYSANLGLAYLYARQYDSALAQLNKTLQMDPNSFITYEYLGQLYRATGKYELWLQSWAKKAALNKNSYRSSSVEQLSRAYRTGGYSAAVRRKIEIEKQALPWRYIDPAELAYEYAALRDDDETFRWLEKAYKERSRSLQTIRVEPSMDALRADVRYVDLLHRMGLEN
jgi:hypothetical protein